MAVPDKTIAVTLMLYKYLKCTKQLSDFLHINYKREILVIIILLLKCQVSFLIHCSDIPFVLREFEIQFLKPLVYTDTFKLFNTCIWLTKYILNLKSLYIYHKEIISNDRNRSEISVIFTASRT